ncbi:hypothetical protein J6V85_02020 [Candidatus Saccharibacteria bacterium]|nr:hypothetical protein [Candidatus Saccharibacteria bacterium]
MADKETELEWEKSKRIEAERMKAVKALENNEESRVNLAFLEPENRKIHGFSRDFGQISRSAERAADFSVGFIFFGILLKSMSHILPMSGGAAALLGVLMTIISMIGLVMICIAPVMAIVSLWFSYKYGAIKESKNKSAIMMAVITLVATVVYAVLYFFVIKY